MKRFLCFLCAVYMYGLYSTILAEEVSIATKWYGVQYVHYDSPNEEMSYIHSLTYTLEGDTTINSIKYSKLLLTYKNGKLDKAYRGALRQSADGTKVYYVPSGKINDAPITKEYLLYDFDVKVGDVVKAYAGFNDASCIEMETYEPDYTIVQDWQVTDVKIIDGRKHVFVTNKSGSYLANAEIEWIEGIGTKYILWSKGRGCYATGPELRMQRTLCATSGDDVSLYSYDVVDMNIINNCTSWEVITSVESVSTNSAASASKFLRNGQLFIKHNGKTYDVTGKEVK